MRGVSEGGYVVLVGGGGGGGGVRTKGEVSSSSFHEVVNILAFQKYQNWNFLYLV